MDFEDNELDPEEISSFKEEHEEEPGTPEEPVEGFNELTPEENPEVEAAEHIEEPSNVETPSEGFDELTLEENPLDKAEKHAEEPASTSQPREIHLDISDHGDQRAWYVIHCYSGYENKVRHNLEQRIETMGMKDKIFDVIVPTQEEIEVKEGKAHPKERHVFPGYVLVNMILAEESWYVVRNTPGVTGFVGMGNDPTPLRSEEVTSILKRMEEAAPHMVANFKPGDRVRITDGPFNDFHGVVNDLDQGRAKVTVMVNFFGRETPVEMDFVQVEKA